MANDRFTNNSMLLPRDKPSSGDMKLPGNQTLQRKQGGQRIGANNTTGIQGASGQANIVDEITSQDDKYRQPNIQPTVGNAINAATSTIKDVGNEATKNFDGVASRVGDVVSGTYDAHKQRVANKGVFPVIGEGIRDIGSDVASGINSAATSAISPINATSKYLFGPNSPQISQGSTTTPIGGLDKYNTPQFKVSSAQSSIDRLSKGINDISSPSINTPTQLSPTNEPTQVSSTNEPTKLGTQQQQYKSFQGVAGTNNSRLQPSGNREALTIGSVDNQGRPTGPNSGSISFADGRTLSSEQKNSLGKIIDRNSDPAFQQKMRDQVKIVDDRIAKGKLGEDETRFNDTLSAVGPDRRASILQEKIANKLNNNTSMEGVFQKQANDSITQAREAAKSDREENRLNFDINKQGVSDKENASKNYYTALTSMADKGLDTPAQRFSLAKQYFGKDTMAHLPDVLGDNFKEYQSLGDKQARQEYLIKLGIPL